MSTKQAQTSEYDMDFGELRSAVQEAMDNPHLIGHVVWCVLMSTPKNEAVVYATDALSRCNFGNVNLSELVQFTVDAEDGLVSVLEARYDCSKAIWCEFLAAWAFSVINDANTSPALSVDAKGYPVVMTWEDVSWIMRFEGEEGAKLDRVDWSQWAGIPEHLRS